MKPESGVVTAPRKAEVDVDEKAEGSSGKEEKVCREHRARGRIQENTRGRRK